jgi:RNA polymerase sigma-70 factor (ECF subfamily)
MEGMTGSDGRVVAEGELTLQAVSAALGRLPAEQRAVVALVCIEGASYKEAAEISGVPIGTVMSRLARARRTLHALLNQPARPVRMPARTGS